MTLIPIFIALAALSLLALEVSDNLDAKRLAARGKGYRKGYLAGYSDGFAAAKPTRVGGRFAKRAA